MKTRGIAFLALLAALFLSSCASQQPLAANGDEPLPPAEGPAVRGGRPENTTDMIPQMNDPIW